MDWGPIVAACAIMTLILVCLGVIWARFVLPQAAVRAITRAIKDMDKRLDHMERDAKAVATASIFQREKIASAMTNRAQLSDARANDVASATVDRDGVVAHNLSDSIGRADGMPKDGNYGAAADAALRSPDVG